MLTPFDVAFHWPHVRSHLRLKDDAKSLEILQVLAEAQLDAGGEAITLSHHLRFGRGWSEGQLSRARTVLGELETAGVIAKRPGGGRRGHAWSFSGNLAHRWRVDWRESGRSVERAIQGCGYRAQCPLAPNLPAQGVALSRGVARFGLSASAHLGLHPVEPRGYGATRATKGQVSDRLGVVPRDYGAVVVPPIPFSLEDLRSSSLTEEEEDVVEALKDAVIDVTGGWLKGDPLLPLVEAARMVDWDVTELCADVRRQKASNAVALAACVPDLARALVRRRARVERGPVQSTVAGLRLAGLFAEADEVEREVEKGSRVGS